MANSDADGSVIINVKTIIDSSLKNAKVLKRHIRMSI